MDSDELDASGLFLDGEFVDAEEQGVLLALIYGVSAGPGSSSSSGRPPMATWGAGDEELAAAAAAVAGADSASPFPDVHQLFRHYNHLYFEGRLDFCSVEWSSSRMTLCAGVCEFRRGGGARIKLSQPLLRLRPVKDLKETLLHEMIHAYLFLEGIRDRGDHGPRFQDRMQRINGAALPDPHRPPGGYNVTIYHSMHAEVDHYRQHWWTCPRCNDLVKRAMNRPPQEADCRGRMGRGAECRDPRCRWHTHLRGCGGAYVKTKSPETPPTAAATAGAKRKLPGTRAVAKAAKAAAAAGAAQLAAAAGSGMRPITSFFQSVGAGSEPGPGRSAPEPSGVASERGPEQPDTKPSGAGAMDGEGEAERRRRCAEAALRRFGGGAGEGGGGGGGEAAGSGRGDVGEGGGGGRGAEGTTAKSVDAAVRNTMQGGAGEGRADAGLAQRQQQRQSTGGGAGGDAVGGAGKGAGGQAARARDVEVIDITGDD